MLIQWSKRTSLGLTLAYEAAGSASGPSHFQDQIWMVQWRNPQYKKHKTWDGDAVLVVNAKLEATLYDLDGKIRMGNTSWKGQVLQPGFRTFIGGKEVELDIAVSASQLPDTQQKFVAPTSFYANLNSKPKAKGPLQTPEALIMKAPTKEHIKKYNKRSLPVVPVVVDPILSRRMRPHQKEGVSFLYECVMGLRKHEGQGCILADEMGLGKTLQVGQNPYAGPLPTVQKVLIVCPVSLVNNWKAEFHKWLGRDRVGILTCDKNNSAVDLLDARSKVYEVLVIGYERLRTVIPPIGLIICDEGHRLKSANNKTAAMFKALSTRRRVILSGTPIQNDLGEFHAMADFCNPGLLGNVYTKEIQIGEARTAQLLSISKSFVLRRDATLLRNHLPPKSEFVIFVTPTPLQLAMFTKILNPKKLDDLIQSSTAESLALINILTKISNSPILLKATADSSKSKKSDNIPSTQQTSVTEALDLLPEKAHIADMTLSGKLIALSKTLKILRQNTSEKCVLVSHYTSTLNILEAYCKKMSYSYFRLDGQTPQNKRQEYVNAFNAGNQHNSFVFLLSSKAGGVGINLIGASRLFIIDSDWNPSHDLQSMARCHRDGQKRPVYIYRLLTAGAIDEKIYQRQVTKLALSDCSCIDSFTRKDLRDIFRIHPDTACNTHDLLECTCDGDSVVDDTTSVMIDGEDDQTEMGFVCASDVRTEDLDLVEKAYLQKKKAGLAALGEWNHINCLKPSASELVQDDIIRRIIATTAERPDVSPGLEKDRTPLDILLSGVDIDAIQAMDKPRSLRDVPGGTISFLFEKCSKTNLEDIIDE
ncbi:P-loop containing nucleoside triphosphate hydrolase protein [Flammula alnicola]|nr:P-loop containing nucleoside triphosphate hydrolase protein [Flammula alnicola]